VFVTPMGKWAACWRAKLAEHSSIRTTYPEVLTSRAGSGASSSRQCGIPRISAAASPLGPVENPKSRVRIGTGPVTGQVRHPPRAPPFRHPAREIDATHPGFRAGSARKPDSTSSFRRRRRSPRLRQLRRTGAPDGGSVSAASFGSDRASAVNKKDNFRFQQLLDGASRYILNVGESAPSVAYNATPTDSTVSKLTRVRGLQTGGPIRSAELRHSRPSQPSGILGLRFSAERSMGSSTHLRPWPDVEYGRVQYGQRTDAEDQRQPDAHPVLLTTDSEHWLSA